MEKERIVLNTLIQQKEQQNGKSQIDIIKDLLPLGYRNFEIRREYLSNTLDELKDLADLKLKYRLVYFYSIPENLFVEHHLNPEILQFISEAQMMGANYLKMTLGDFSTNEPQELNWLNEVLPNSLQLNLENDQTDANANVNTLLNFFKVAKDLKANIGFVNDLGNWVFTSQDELNATKELLPFTRYIHLKGYQKQDGLPVTTSFIDSDLDWQELLSKFNSNLPVGIEYPASVDKLQEDLNVLKTF
jgi:sugar phosphate isomerase/epimerase